ncbi:MAG: hypothetical protein EOO88_56020 [Pedobacter sp.]|nr:MAG: hypothetical protein EOO88_56020 [Pedobacter sp.]
MTAEDYEAAFHGIELPQSAQLFTGVFVPDVRAFIAKELHILKNNPLDRTADPVKYRLDRLLEVINELNESQ